MKHLLTGLALCAAPAFGQGLEDLGIDRVTLRAEIRAYLLENPEVLMEAMDVLRAREAEAKRAADKLLVAELSQQLTDDGVSYVGGNPEGDVTLVEFIDYQCGYCKLAHGDVKTLLETDGQIRYVVKELPILGPLSQTASQAAVATLLFQTPEVYGNFNDALLSFKGQLSEPIVYGLARQAGADVDQLREDMSRPEVQAHLNDIRSLAARLQISGTPAFVLGDEVIRGFQPLDQMRGAVATAREKS
ncbi:MAG: DsbA family protein [Pseudomonadota bacterium]